MSQVGRAAWSLLAGLSVAASLWSLAADAITTDPGCCSYSNGTATSCSNSLSNATCTGPSFNGTFSPGEVCGDDASCRPALTGCCDTGDSCFPSIENEVDCIALAGAIVEGATCDVTGNATVNGWGQPVTGLCATFTPTATATATATPTATATATATATSTQIPDGGTCTEPSACASDNCVDGFCCDTPCDGPLDVCDAEGQEGTCVPGATMAPAASNTGLLLLVAGLAALAVFTLARRRKA